MIQNKEHKVCFLLFYLRTTVLVTRLISFVGGNHHCVFFRGDGKLNMNPTEYEN